MQKDVFHWTCLNKYCSSLPANTAPAGYSCINCNVSIFPSSNTPSPIYISLKKKLSTTEWARIGLGLPVTNLSNNNSNSKLNTTNSPTRQQAADKLDQQQANQPQINNPIQQTFEQKRNLNSNVFIHHEPQSASSDQTPQSIPVSVNNVSNYLNNHNIINDYTNHNNFSSFNSSSRKIVDSDYSTDRLILDIDEDKYRHRSPLDRLNRNLKFLDYKLNLNSHQRFTILIVFAVLIAFFIFYYLVKQAREADDPLLDYKKNPNIHLQDVDNFY